MEPPLLDRASSSTLGIRDRVLCWYRGEWGAGVWHERLLVRPVSATLWFIATPGGEAYLEKLVGGVRPDSPVKCVRMVQGRVPVGLQGGTRLFTTEVSESEWSRLCEASEEARLGHPYSSMLLRGERTWFDEEVTQRVPEGAAALSVGRGLLPSTDDDMWLLSSALLNDEGVTVYKAGVEMKVGKSDLLGARFGIHFLTSGEEVVVERVPRALVSRFSPLVRADAPASVGSDRPRPLTGLPTLLARLGSSLSRWVVRRWQTDGWAPTNRMCVIAEVLELAAQCDQVNLGTLACMERLCRHMAAIERQRVKKEGLRGRGRGEVLLRDMKGVGAGDAPAKGV